MKWIEKILEVKPYIVKTLGNDGNIRLINLEEFLENKSKKTESSYNKGFDKTYFR